MVPASIPFKWWRPTRLPNYTDDVLRLTAGCSVEATGTIVPSPAKGQPFEMQASAVKVIGWVEDPDSYPIQPKPHTLEFLREVAHLRPRTNVIGAVTRVRHTIAQSIHRFFHEHGFVWVNTPIITASDAEGAGELFRVSTLDLMNLPRTPEGKIDFTQDFFGRETFLTVSGQLNVETYCMALSKVYTFGPTFRAENSNTSRHLAEFWMIEPEIAFANLADDATLAEALLKHIFKTVLSERADDMAFFEERIEKGVIAKLQGIVDSEFVRMDYTEAIRHSGEGEGEIRVPGQVGHRPAIRARALCLGEARRQAGRPDELPEGDQGVLHAAQRRRQDRRGDGRARTGDRRDHRRQPTRGAARGARCPYGRGQARQGALRLVSRPASLRHGAARGIRPGVRAHGGLRDRTYQRARCDSVPADAGECEVLSNRPRGSIQDCA